MRKLLTKIVGDPETKTLKRMQKRIAGINELGGTYKNKGTDELRKLIDDFKKDVRDEKKKVDDILPDAFAVTREMSERTIGMRHFDVQLVGGMVLHEGSVAEMRTGEGKTLVATLPVVLNALEGKGVHVVTVNDYLAQRDAGWMGQLYDALGLSVSVIIAEKTFIYDNTFQNEEHDDERMKHLRPCSRREGYEADITYGTNNEFGFDYLRDNMVRLASDLRQRPLHYAIVDEVDSILIDEARTPLIISAPSASSGSAYATFAQIARRLDPEDYEKDEKRRSVIMNDEGVQKVQEWLSIDNLYAPENVRLIYHLDQALRAEVLFKRDKHYVVTEDGEVVIVDEFTGRLMHGRRYNEGLHQAIEAKEGVEVLQESMTLATISFQNYFRLYSKLSGMTGTALTEKEEFYEIYKLDVVPIPTNKPVQREDKTDRIYRTESGKFKAIAREVKALQEKGQPVLIGTASVEKNEVLSRALSKAGVKHEVLNAKNHEREASIVAGAGQAGAVTVATNIAGRGTDIVLGNGVADMGGLVVIGSERHESRRIDNQLRGRCGRQGDPGMTQFYVSAEDDLMRVFGGERIATLMNRLGVDEDTPIENRAVTKALENAQKKVESHNFDTRKHVVQYDDVMNRHRKATYSARQAVLSKESIQDKVKELVASEVAALASVDTSDREQFLKEVQAVMPIEDAQAEELKKADSEKIPEVLGEIAEAFYELKEKVFSKEVMRRVEREIYLQVLDTNWMQHLENMDHLREGIGWRGVGQRDPLVEYRREGQGLFEQMQDRVQNETVRALFHAEPREPEKLEEPVETELTRAAAQSVASGASSSSGSTKSKKESKEEKRQSVTSRGGEEPDAKAESKRKRDSKKKKKAKRKKGRR